MNITHALSTGMGTRTFFSLLPEERRRAYLDYGQVQSFRARTRITHEGDPANRVFLIMEGWVQITGSTMRGEDILLRLVGPGDLVGLESVAFAPEGVRRYDYLHSAETRERVRALAISTVAFRELTTTYRADAIAALDSIAQRIHQADRRLRQAAGNSGNQLAGLLLMLADWYGLPNPSYDGDPRKDPVYDGSITIGVALSQTELARWAGMSRETVTRAFRSWREHKLIRTERRKIVIIDPEQLARASLTQTGQPRPTSRS